ncbi:unnamed protein product [Prorocentrum cordatum]|uniref:Uncharacterized protein n=1 Tax=Prorocentrum cordatum TaxID=2364126 RepID=A0ABN9SDZ5_9DINO|nr:unnamed protein product [Polarella glacialis]
MAIGTPRVSRTSVLLRYPFLLMLLWMFIPMLLMAVMTFLELPILLFGLLLLSMFGVVRGLMLVAETILAEFFLQLLFTVMVLLMKVLGLIARLKRMLVFDMMFVLSIFVLSLLTVVLLTTFLEVQTIGLVLIFVEVLAPSVEETTFIVLLSTFVLVTTMARMVFIVLRPTRGPDFCDGGELRGAAADRDLAEVRAYAVLRECYGADLRSDGGQRATAERRDDDDRLRGADDRVGSDLRGGAGSRP